MDIVPTAKFQESLSNITLSIHMSYLKNQILCACKQILPQAVSSKIFMSDIDNKIHNEILNSMHLQQSLTFFKSKDPRFKDAAGLMNVKNQHGKICVLNKASPRLQVVLMCLFSKKATLSPDLLDKFEDFLTKSLKNFEKVIEKVTNLRVKSYEMEKTLSKSIPFSQKTQTQRLMQFISEITADDPPLIYYHIMLLILQITKSKTGAFTVYNQDVDKLKIFVVKDKLKDIPTSFQIQEKSFLTEIIEQNACVILKKEDLKGQTVESLREILDGYPNSINTLLVCATVITMTKGLKIVLFLADKVEPDAKFTQNDLEFVIHVSLYAAPIIHLSNNLQVERLERTRTQKLLMVAKNIFSRMDNFDDLIINIMSEAQSLTGAEGCSLFLLDEERNELVSKLIDNESKITFRKDIRFPVTDGIAGLVATSGKMLNIKDAYEHPSFNRNIDEINGFRTKSILCFPIQNDRGKVVGVAQLCNKIGFPYFNKYDEDIAMAFSVFCHISIINSLIYKRIEDAQQRSVLANKVMTSHNRAKEKISHALIEKHVNVKMVPPDQFLPKCTQLTSVPKTIIEKDTVMFCISMFDKMGLINRWHISRHTLAVFMLSVKRGYRDVPYHNWYHALGVGHFIFAAYHTFKLENYLEDLENFVLFIAGFCHDIDHRGTNNSFQTKSKSVLASLYSSEGSMLEQHHFAQTVCILQTEHSNIFESLDHSDYLKALDLLRYIILATDLVHHFKKKPELDKLANRPYKLESTRDRTLLMCILITSADLSDQIKPWKAAYLSTRAITTEFLSQGDMERELGNEPLENMDRHRAIIPIIQLSFIDYVVSPLFQTLKKLFAEVEECCQNIKNNATTWKSLLEMVNNGTISGLSDSIFEYIEANML